MLCGLCFVYSVVMVAFWNKFKRSRREDPVFGSMLSMGGYWEGHALFTPTGRNIDVFVDGGPETDMEPQHAAFQQVQKLWPALQDQFAAALQDMWRERYPDAEASSAWEHFSLISITVPQTPLEGSEWEIDFATPRDEHLFSFTMKGGQILASSMNG